MRFSKRTEYGLRAMVQLARLRPGQFVQSKDLAAAEELPTKFLESILLSLRRGGFLESKVGSGGGYRLARPAGEVTVGQIVGLLDRRDAEPTPPTPGPPGTVALRLVSGRLTAAADGVLGELTLEALLDDVARATGGQASMYYI